MQVTISAFENDHVSIFDASIPYDGLGTGWLGTIHYSRASGLIDWFRHDNRFDPWKLCQSLVESGYATKHPGGPGIYGHVDYRVTARFRDALAFQAEEAEEHGRQAAAEIAAETNIPQHLVW